MCDLERELTDILALKKNRIKDLESHFAISCMF